jgi:hypothetical protein
MQECRALDSKTVSREVKRRIWTLLKEAGFDTFTPRTAWRHGDEGVDVFNVQSFSKYNADVLGVTPHSFRVNLGWLPTYIPPRWPPKVKDGKLLPDEAGCLIRGMLLPTMSTPSSSPHTWSIDAGGNNLSWAIQDVVNQLPKAFQWYGLLCNRLEVLRILQNDDESFDRFWGFGRNPSPVRSYSAGYAALALGDTVTAKKHLQDAVESKCFVHLFSSVEGALARAI